MRVKKNWGALDTVISASDKGWWKVWQVPNSGWVKSEDQNLELFKFPLLLGSFSFLLTAFMTIASNE